MKQKHLFFSPNLSRGVPLCDLYKGPRCYSDQQGPRQGVKSMAGAHFIYCNVYSFTHLAVLGLSYGTCEIFSCRI